MNIGEIPNWLSSATTTLSLDSSCRKESEGGPEPDRGGDDQIRPGAPEAPGELHVHARPGIATASRPSHHSDTTSSQVTQEPCFSVRKS